MKTLITTAIVCAGSFTLAAPSTAEAGHCGSAYRGSVYGGYGTPVYRGAGYRGGYGYNAPVYGHRDHAINHGRRGYYGTPYHNSGYRGRGYRGDGLSIWGRNGGLNVRW